MDPTSLGFRKHFFIEISNSGSISLENNPVILDVFEIRKAFPDFNTSNYAIFEEVGGEFRLVVSQPDDLDKDRISDEIVLIRSLPAESTSVLTCYYSPEGNFRMMSTPHKAATRLSWDPGKIAAGWESNLSAFTMSGGRIEFLGKFAPGLILRRLTPGMTARQEWGMAVLNAGAGSGLGGLALWDGASPTSLTDPAGTASFKIQRTVLSSGPLRAILEVRFSGINSDRRERDVILRVSAFADNRFSRQDVQIQSESASGLFIGPGIQKLPGESWNLEDKKGYAASWGEGVRGAGGIGMAVLFSPDAFAGMEETDTERFIKLKVAEGGKRTFWITGGWEKGFDAPLPPRARNWGRKTEALAGKLLAPVEVRFKLP